MPLRIQMRITGFSRTEFADVGGGGGIEDVHAISRVWYAGLLQSGFEELSIVKRDRVV